MCTKAVEKACWVVSYGNSCADVKEKNFRRRIQNESFCYSPSSSLIYACVLMYEEPGKKARKFEFQMNGNIGMEQRQRRSSNFCPNSLSLSLAFRHHQLRRRKVTFGVIYVEDLFSPLSRKCVSQFLPSLHHRKQSKINKQASERQKNPYIRLSNIP